MVAEISRDRHRLRAQRIRSGKRKGDRIDEGEHRLPNTDQIDGHICSERPLPAREFCSADVCKGSTAGPGQ